MSGLHTHNVVVFAFNFVHQSPGDQTTQERAKAKVEFRIHLINYIVINTLLAIINLTLTPEYIWFKWPLLGWGIGIIFHALIQRTAIDRTRTCSGRNRYDKLNVG